MMARVSVSVGQAGTLEVQRSGTTVAWMAFPADGGERHFVFQGGDSVRWATGVYPSVHYSGGTGWLTVPDGADVVTVYRTSETSQHSTMTVQVDRVRSKAADLAVGEVAAGNAAAGLLAMVAGILIWSCYQRARR